MTLQIPSRRRLARSLRAFTLMELLIVVAILILLVVITLPRVKYALDESKLRESSRQLNSFFALAKSRAASTGRPCGLWFVSTQIGDPATAPGFFQSTEVFLAEVPAPYTGDMLDARAYVSNFDGTSFATAANGPNGSPPNPWRINFPGGGAASLVVLVAPGEFFRIRFDHKGPIFSGRRGDTTLPAPLNDPNYFFIIGGPTVPPVATGMAGYSFEIIRNPARIGAPLSLPQGTCVDLSFSGFGNYGVNFFTEFNPAPSIAASVANPAALVLFSADGHIDSASYRTWDSDTMAYEFVSNDAPGTVHFLIGRPEKVGNPLLQSNLADNNALWVSVGRLTGSVITTDNVPNIDLPYATVPEQQYFLTVAREFAITQNVKGGR